MTMGLSMALFEETVMDPRVGDYVTLGIGEIGIVGKAAAIANAEHHATGVRVRDLPLSPDELLGRIPR